MKTHPVSGAMEDTLAAVRAQTGLVVPSMETRWRGWESGVGDNRIHIYIYIHMWNTGSQHTWLQFILIVIIV